jgi:hypothetical protein
MQKAAGASNTNGPHTDTNSADFRTDGTINQGKAIATQLAHLAIAGHTVHKLVDGGYLVCKYGYTHHAQDFASLQCFARRLGVSNEL